MLFIDISYYCKVSHIMIWLTLRQLLIKKIPIRTLTRRPKSRSRMRGMGICREHLEKIDRVMVWLHCGINLKSVIHRFLLSSYISMETNRYCSPLGAAIDTIRHMRNTVIWAVATKQNKITPTSVVINHTVSIKINIYVRNRYFRG